jgi:hypothetical protein
MTQLQSEALRMRISRRQFIATSAAAGLARVVQRHNSSACAQVRSSNQDLTLAPTGNAQQGYGAAIQFRGKPIARHNDGGEFSAIFQNSDRSLQDQIENWRADSYEGAADHLLLKGKCELPNLKATVFAEVQYQAAAPYIIRKRIRFHQVDVYDLFFQVSNCLEPFDAPASFWSFDPANCKGGALREYFPAAGFRTNLGITVGLLTDSGYRNQWSRFIRRDAKPAKPAPHHVPDVNLYYVCRGDDRGQHHFFVKQTFGQALVREEEKSSGTLIVLPPAAAWHRLGDLHLEEQDGTISLSIHGSDGRAIIPFLAKDDEVYSLRLKYRSPQAFSLQLWDVDQQLTPLGNITLYNDRIPASSEWSEFQTEVYFPSLQGQHGAISISNAESDQAINAQSSGNPRRIELGELKLRRLATRLEPYHRLAMDRPAEKTSFIFVDEHIPDTLRGYRSASQQYLADGLGFRGGDTEKAVYSDLMMLCWSASPQNPEPMVAPSIWYSAAGEMYMRDSFYSLNGIHDRELNE